MAFKKGVAEILKECSEITGVGKRQKQAKFLQQNTSPALKAVLGFCYDPKIKWLLPPGDVPYTVNEAPLGTEHTLLSQEAKRLYLFIEGGDTNISQTKRETLFVQLLEGLSAEEAAFLITVKDQKVNNEYKGFTANLVKEAFNWDDNFMKKSTGTTTSSI